MNSLLLLNGSPRGPRSNSMRMLTRVAEGWKRAGGAEPQVLHLAKRADFERAVAAFAEADTVLLGMPLYTDSMPGARERVHRGARAAASGVQGNPRLGFLVQSGFIGGAALARARALPGEARAPARVPYAGTIVRGGGEALQAMPDAGRAKLFERLRGLGEPLARDGRFEPARLQARRRDRAVLACHCRGLSVACQLRRSRSSTGTGSSRRTAPGTSASPLPTGRALGARSPR